MENVSIKKRLKSKSPSLFVKIQKIGLILTGLGTTLIGLQDALKLAGSEIILPTVIATIGGYILAAGITAVSVAKLTIDESSIK